METIQSQLTDPKKAAKIAAVPILAMVLAFLVFGRSDGEAGTGNGAVTLNPGVAQTADPASDVLKLREEAAVTETKRAGPSFDVEQVLRSNPFLLPVALQVGDPPAEDAEGAQREAGSKLSAEEDDSSGSDSPLRAMAEALAQKSVSIIASTPQGRVAFIDSRVVAVGDYLQKGVRVVEISPDGVVVEIEGEQ